MKTWTLLVAPALLAPQADAPDPAAAPVAAPVPAFEGTLAEGLAEIQRASAAGEAELALAVSESLLAPNEFTRWRRELEAQESKVVAPALELVDPLLERLGLNGYPEPLRAEVMYARGCVRLAAEERALAEEEFARARAASGPGELRKVAAYNRGTAALLEAEVWRAKIPEISGGAAPPVAPPVAGPPGMSMPGAPAEEDPLKIARSHYERAKEALIERLRVDWRDADTRANVELVQRRLKELDEIEREREKQQQEQQQDQQQDQQQGDPQKQDPSDEAPQDEAQEEQEQEQPPESEGEEPEPEEEEGDPQEQEGEPPADAKESEQEVQPKEIYLTREEVQRLLERLRAHEEEAEALRARLYQQSRKRVERDW